MTPAKPARKPNRPVLPMLAFGAIILALLGLLLQFEEPRLAVVERLQQLASATADRARTVYVETQPIGGGSHLMAGDAVSIRLRIGLQDRQAAARFKQMEPAFYGEMLRTFDGDPVAADPETGRFDLPGIESRVRGVLSGLLGDAVVRDVRVTELRRRVL